MRLSSVHAKKTSQILRPDAIKFSPCIGLLTSSTPNLIANLRTMQLDTPGSELARELFHQRTSAYEGGSSSSTRRYGPVAITKSRSRASYWLSPRIMGTMIGLAKFSSESPNALLDGKIDDALHSLGIETNYVNREWSGVSMVRYRKIVRLLARDFEDEATMCKNGQGVSALPVALAFVWEKAKTKRCLLDYLLSVENASASQVILPEYSDLRLEGSAMQKDWISTQFAHDFITAERVHAESLVFLNSKFLATSDAVESQRVGEALEVITASLAMERCFKPPIKLGRYAYGDGKARPDCVEVVVREILDSLIYDSASGRMCPELLPATTLPAVVNFYRCLESGEISDVSTMPAQTALKPEKRRKNSSNGGVESTSISGEVVAGDGGEAVTGSVKQYWETTTAGRMWFDLCSELSGAGYLSSTADGRQYELKPTMLNVCAAARVLLGADATAPAATTVVGSAAQDVWKLKDLESFWNNHASDLSARTKNCPIRPILTSESTLRFRAPFSDTETINRELGSIQFVGARNAIDIELESAHQLATVKHRLCVDPSQRLWGAQTRAFYAKYANGPSVAPQDVESDLKSMRSVVCSTVLGDSLLVSVLKDIRGSGEAVPASQQLDGRIQQALVAARWGEERRQGSDNIDSDTDSAPLSVTDASLTTADAKRQVESSVRMSTQALELIGHCQEASLATQLTKWMLQEAPPQLSFDAITTTLLRYPVHIRSSLLFLEMIDSVLGTTDQRGAVMRRILSFGTELCPSHSQFGLFDRANVLSVQNKMKVAIFYAKYRIRG